MPHLTARSPLVSLDDAAEYMATSTRTIRRWITAGRLPAYKAGGKLIRIRLTDLDAMLRPVQSAVA